jgi:hypothetical protein
MVDLDIKDRDENDKKEKYYSRIPWMALGWVLLFIVLILILAFCSAKDVSAQEGWGSLPEGYCWNSIEIPNSLLCTEHEPFGTFIVHNCVVGSNVDSSFSCAYTSSITPDFIYFPLVTVQRTIIGDPIGGDN